jgi:F-type H+-transporting ATPase subunit gamma
MNRDLLHRMKSIRQTVQISSAQKLMAASQIAKAKRMLAESLPYHHNVSRSVASLLINCPGHKSRYIETGGTGAARNGLVVLSASRGLAGGFNGNVMRFVENRLQAAPASHIIAFGLAHGELVQKGYPVDMDFKIPNEPPTMFNARELAEKTTGMLEKGEIDSFDIIYTAFRSSVKLEVVQRRLFPLDAAAIIGEFGQNAGTENYLFEPDPERVIASAVLKYLKGYLYGCLVHTWICELTSRVMAMDNAIRNGNEMLDALTLAYNRGRQAAITQEITEIVAGAAAMETT